MITLLSIQVGLPKNIGTPEASDPMDREWFSGYIKETISGPIWARATNIEGDGQADLAVHGGPDKAINVYPSEHYPYWREELGLSVFPYGAFSENLTLAGLTEADVCIGDQYEIGGASGILVEVSQPRQPCWKLARRWKIKDLAARVERNGRTGWYFRVLREGQIQAGDRLELVSRPFPEWTIAAANVVMNQGKEDLVNSVRLAECPALSQIWKESLTRRVAAKSGKPSE